MSPPKQTLGQESTVAGSQRRSDIREISAKYVDSLVRLYERTDPAKGEPAAEDKLELARQAISMWWYLWAELMLWAQSHLTGYEMLKSNPKLRERIETLLGEEFDSDSHVLEYVGVYFSWNHVNDDDPMLLAIHEIMGEELGISMGDPLLRPIIRELLTARSANSSFWRFPLQEAFFSLDLGEVNDLVKPSEVRRQGDAVALYRWKLLALSHVQYRLGRGQKKYVAQEAVAKAIGQSVETLRSWEKAYSFDDDFVMALWVANLAGKLEQELDRRPLDEIIEDHATEYFRHTSDVEYAKHALAELRANPLEKVREGFFISRTKKNGD